MEDEERLSAARWEARWQEGHTPWDAGEPAGALVRLIESGTLPPGRALVAGSGSGYDAIALAEAGWRVTALDFAPTAAERVAALRDAAGLEARALEPAVADFFAYAPSQPFTLVWDSTFLCAIDPGLRPAWARRMADLLAPDGELAALVFPVPPTYVRHEDGDGGSAVPPGDGPPFALAPHEVATLLLEAFEELVLSPSTAGHPARAGREWLGRWRRR